MYNDGINDITISVENSQTPFSTILHTYEIFTGDSFVTQLSREIPEEFLVT